MKRIVVLIYMLCLLWSHAVSEDVFTVSAPDTITGYAENLLTVNTEINGVLTIEVILDGKVVCTPVRDMAVDAGQSVFCWDGLGSWDRPLVVGEYILSARLMYDDTSFVSSQKIVVGKSAAALQYAFASSQTLYHTEEGLEITYALSRSGNVVLNIATAEMPDETLLKVKRETGNARQGEWTWNGKIAGTRAPEGKYIISVYAAENPQYCIKIPVSVVNEREETLLITGMIMPDDMDDVQDAFNAPAAVADIGASLTLNIYREATGQSEILGTLSGRTQCVEVIETSALWTKVRCWRQEDGTPVEGYVRTQKMKIADVQTQYGLVVNKTEQRLSVFSNGEMIGSVPVSTGRAEYRNLAQETPAGSYLTGTRHIVLHDDRNTFDYAIRFAGSRALYLTDGGVGDKTTSGGIAVPVNTDESEIDAYWLWTHIPPNTRLIIIDDPVQRTLEQACALALTEINAWQPSEKAPGMSADETEVILTLGGDAVIGTREVWMKSSEALPAYIEEYGTAYPFAGLQDYFASDDMTLINLECVLKNDSAGENKEKLYRFRGLASYTDVLTEASVEQVNIANNHHIDYGLAGKASTVEALNSAGIPYSGYGALYACEINGYRIGFGGCRETTWLQGVHNITEEIDTLRSWGCDVVIYTCHWGEEYSPTHNETQLAMAQAVAEAGADIIIGHHPHVVQGVEVVNGVPVLYSLGNLMFGGTHDLETRDGVLARLNLRFDQDGYTGAAITMIPILTSGTDSFNDFRPVPAAGEDALRILAKIQADSSIEIREDMYFPAK